MTGGLITSIVAADLRPSRAVVQLALIPDDQAEIARLRQQLVESEAAYDQVCRYVDDLEAANRKLLAENHTLQVSLELARRVSAYCACGVVRR